MTHEFSLWIISQMYVTIHHLGLCQAQLGGPVTSIRHCHVILYVTLSGDQDFFDCLAYSVIYIFYRNKSHLLKMFFRISQKKQKNRGIFSQLNVELNCLECVLNSVTFNDEQICNVIISESLHSLGRQKHSYPMVFPAYS